VVPHITKNLISVAQFTKENNVYFEFYPHSCFVKHQDSHQILIQGIVRDGLYVFPSSPASLSYTTNHASYKPNVPPLQLWHNRLGHISFPIVQRVLKSCNIQYNSQTQFYNACVFGKADQLPFHASVNKYTTLLQLVFIDIWGPSPVCASNGSRYYISFLDAYSLIHGCLLFLINFRLPLLYVHIINLLLSPVIGNQSPHALLFPHAPDYTSLRTFGCACYPLLRPYNKHKLDFCSSCCLFLGYNIQNRGYICLSSSCKVYISRHVLFQEYLFPYNIPQYNFIPHSYPEILPPNPAPIPLIISQPTSSHPSTTFPIPLVSSHSSDLPSSDTIQPSSFDLSLPHSRTTTNLNNYSMITLPKVGICKPKTFLSNTILQSSIPVIITEALHSP